MCSIQTVKSISLCVKCSKPEVAYAAAYKVAYSLMHKFPIFINEGETAGFQISTCEASHESLSMTANSYAGVGSRISHHCVPLA